MAPAVHQWTALNFTDYTPVHSEYPPSNFSHEQKYVKTLVLDPDKIE